MIIGRDNLYVIGYIVIGLVLGCLNYVFYFKDRYNYHLGFRDILEIVLGTTVIWPLMIPIMGPSLIKKLLDQFFLKDLKILKELEDAP